MELMNQPFTGQLGDRLVDLLESPDYDTLTIIVAFAKNSGVLRIKDSLKRFRERGGVVNVYVGVDLGGTSYEALTALRIYTDSLKVIHSEKGQTFHPKIYQLSGKDNDFIVVGSHNLTGGGLWTNFESSVLLSVDRESVSDMQVFKGLQDYIVKLNSLGDSVMSIKEQKDIDKLLQHGYVFKEIAQRVRLMKAAKQDGTRESLFGRGVSANLPRIAPATLRASPASAPTATATVSAPSVIEGQTIWFETRSMTGGSRNILDLSKRSLVERGDPVGTPFDLNETDFMRGGVEFFGLNPTDTSETRNVTLSFEGIDYEGNTILFPQGAKSNGTWRLQIKGVSSSQEKITDAFRAKYGQGDYLVEKIITFTKVVDDYYFMSVFPESELENFKMASSILARNGLTRNAKQFGLF